MVQVRLVFVANDDLEIAIRHLLISCHDDSNHKVEHDDLQEVRLAEEDEPDQVDVDVYEDTQRSLSDTVLIPITVLLQEGVVARKS